MDFKTIRIKGKNGTIYLYEDRSFLDKEVKKTGLKNSLDKAFGEAAADWVLALSCYLICRGKALSRSWQGLTDRGIRFTVPVPSSVKWGKELIREHRDSLIHPSHFINDGKTKVYGKTVYKMTEHGRTWYHIFFDPARKDMMQASFMSRLQQCKDELEQNQPKECHQAIYDEFFIVKDSPKRGRRVIYDDEALQNYLNNDSCYWILLSNTEKDAAKALASYRERGGVELSFDDIKNVLDLNRLRCNTKTFPVFRAFWG